jgi:hypothetical protein
MFIIRPYPSFQHTRSKARMEVGRRRLECLQRLVKVGERVDDQQTGWGASSSLCISVVEARPPLLVGDFAIVLDNVPCDPNTWCHTRANCTLMRSIIGA